MFSWAPFAILRFSLFFIIGILCAIYTDERIAFQWAICFLLFSIVLFLILRLTKPKLLQAYGYALVMLFAFFTGYLCLFFHNVKNEQDHIGHFNERIEAYQLHVSLAPEEKAKSYKIEGEILRIKTQGQWQAASGKVLLYVSHSAASAAIQYGDILLIQGTPQPLSGPANPHEFDYKRFLSFRNIYHQQFVPDGQWMCLGSDPKHLSIFYAQQIRAWAAEQLQRHISGKQQQVIALALVLGLRDGIDNELQEAYAASGAMHVLAVSGLHVGVIFLLLNFVFKRFAFFEKYKWMQASICILALWTFAFVTGLSASVLRAVTMFSLFALAKAMGRGDNIYNTLAAAALILLLIDPYLIMSVGFQLSFLAVLGIVSITRGVYELWLPKYLFIDKVWQISCVAFAAQLSTFALGMLYFHQFPSFFFFSNLFVIPGAFVILLSGLACLLLSPVHELAAIIGGITEVCIWFINQVVFFIEVLPYSKINHIYIDTSQTWLLLLLIAALVTFFYQHNLGWLKLAFSMAIVLSLSVWVHFYQARKNPQLTFYKVNGLMALDWIENGNAYFFKDDVEWYDAERIRFHIRPNRLANSVHSIHTIGHTNLISTDWADVLQVKDKSICLIRQSPHNLAAQVHVDFVVLDKSWKGKLSELNERLSFEKLIISTAINHQRAAKLQQEALDLGIDFYNVHQQGALTIKL